MRCKTARTNNEFRRIIPRIGIECGAIQDNNTGVSSPGVLDCVLVATTTMTTTVVEVAVDLALIASGSWLLPVRSYCLFTEVHLCIET